MDETLCECGHNKKAHVESGIVGSCFFNYNCGCDKFKPIALSLEDRVKELESQIQEIQSYIKKTSDIKEYHGDQPRFRSINDPKSS